MKSQHSQSGTKPAYLILFMVSFIYNDSSDSENQNIFLAGNEQDASNVINVLYANLQERNQIRLPDCVMNISGLSVSPDGSRFAAVTDNTGNTRSVGVYKMSGKCKTSWSHYGPENKPLPCMEHIYIDSKNVY